MRQNRWVEASASTVARIINHPKKRGELIEPKRTVLKQFSAGDIVSSKEKGIGLFVLPPKSPK